MKETSYLVLSDIHIGHKVNTADRIFNNLLHYFTKLVPLLHTKENPNGIKAIFIAGDLFDRFLPSYSEEYLIANKFLVFLVKYCQKYNLILRVLEGTPLHDWGQSKMLSEILKELSIEVKFRYVDDLEIEYIKELDLNVLYLPDEYRHKASDTLKEVKKLLKKHNLEQVDIAIMHGAFQYQIPMLSLDICHSEEEYDKIVKYAIHIGHVHTYSHKGKIIAQGSFDRLAHGEEEPKYGIVASINKQDKDKPLTFTKIENTKAMIFKTIKLIDKPIKPMITEVKQLLKKIPPKSSIRFITEDKEKMISVLDAIDVNLDKIYNIKITLNTDSKSKKDIFNTVSNTSTVLETFSITPANILSLVESELNEVNTDKELMNKALLRLEDIASKVKL